MGEITTLGVDLAKSAFQLHGVDAEGRVVLRRQQKRSQMLEFFQRRPPCLIGLEACASAHLLARALIKARNVSTTLRQWLLDFRLGFLRLALVG